MTYTTEDAVREVAHWRTSPSQVYRLFGYAGTGKTTLAQHVADDRTLFAAYTGKAASVLRSKGCHGASTIHSLIYKPKAKSREELEKLIREGAPKVEIAAARAEYLRPEFTLNPDSALIGASLLVLDEVSMVNPAMARDLESFGTKILCLGDPAQLPPVEGGGHYTDAVPDLLLTQVHRSAADSPVTRLATIARQSVARDFGIDGMDGDSGRTADRVSIRDFDQIICGTNRKRWELLGRFGRRLAAGRRVMALANNPDEDVFNGQQFTLVAAPAEIADGYRLHVISDDGGERELRVRAEGFTGHDGEGVAKSKGRRGPVAATFGEVVTCHKAQGSQWERVLVIDESRVFTRSGVDIPRRWFYTALTRASQQVVIK